MKKKRDPWAEGSLKDIFSLFFRPTIKKYCPEGTHPKTFFEDLLNIDYRDIKLYKARRDFKMPGLYYLTANQKVQGIGYREVKKDTIVWVREDLKQPNKAIIDIEFFGGRGDKDQVFNLSPQEWNSIIHLLEPIDEAA